MHGVNLDLLRASAAHFPDGRCKDTHAHHRAELRALARAARHDRWVGRMARLRRFLARRPAPESQFATDPHP